MAAACAGGKSPPSVEELEAGRKHPAIDEAPTPLPDPRQGRLFSAFSMSRIA